MFSGLDIWRAAGVLIKRYGDHFHACMRADALNAQGDREGMRTWMRILKAIDQLQTLQPGEIKH